MTATEYAMKPSDVEHGNVCPECAGPKHRQSKRCAACYYDARRRGEYPPPPRPKRTAVAKPKGGSRGRPQPQDHPWRKRDALLFVKSRASAMASDGVRPATAGARARAHFSTLTEDAA